MSKIIYLSPSNHGVNQNKCKIAGCYEDKHTRPIADETAKHLKYNGFNVIVADANRSVIGRCNDANKLGVDLYVPIHTNASSSSSARYLLFMAYNTTGKYDTLFDCIKSYMKDIYDGNIMLQKRRNLIEINTPKAMSFYCEMGFHTNLDDCNNFIHEPKKVGKALAQGICKYFGVVFKDYTTTKKTAMKKVDTAVANKDLAAAQAALPAAISAIESAASKGVYHKNNAARKVARVTKAVNTIA